MSTETAKTARLFLAGVVGGLVVLFKIACFPIVMAFWALEYVSHARKFRSFSLSSLAAIGTPLFLGLLVPSLGFLAYVLHNGVLELVVWTFFEHPARVMAVAPLRFVVLAASGAWFVATFAPVEALAVVGAGMFFRPTRAKRRHWLGLNMLAWFAIGLALILFQRFSWWRYHFLLLLVPLGILATLGLGTDPKKLNT